MNSQKKNWLKKITGPRNFVDKEHCWSKNFRVKKVLGPKKWAQNFFFSSHKPLMKISMVIEVAQMFERQMWPGKMLSSHMSQLSSTVMSE